jgi:GntR family transcriptional regulator/MocR family aminotransferase
MSCAPCKSFALDAFPRKLWSRLVARHARAFAPTEMAYPEPSGYPPLREAIAGYLATSRGVRCEARQILITNGYQDALNLAASVLLRRGDKVWLEDPGYPPAGRGAQGRGRGTGPSHQSPLRVATSLPRRLAPLSSARDAGAWIIEDDYDSEFRYVGRPPARSQEPRSR